MGKIRRVDFYPDEFLSGVDQLSPEEIGVYWLVCSKIYSRGGALPDDDRENARIFRLRLRMWGRLKAALVAKGKLEVSDNTIINRRCMIELSKAHKRIDDAHKNGELGGRPPASFEVSPSVTSLKPGDHPVTNGVATGFEGDNSPPELNGNNDVAKATGSPDQKPNQQPATYQPPEETPPPGNKTYAFTGKVIRLTAVDFEKWQAEFRETIPDLMAQLADDDAYYDRTMTGKDRTQWFHRLHRKLLKNHQRVLSERESGRRPNLSESF